MEPTAPRQRHDAFHVFSLMSAKVVRAPLWLLISALVARTLEPKGLGAWSMILASATLLNHVLVHWTQSLTQRFGQAELRTAGHLDNTWSTRWPLLAIGLLMVVTAVVVSPANWLGRFYGIDGQMRWFVLPAMFSIWLMAEAQGVQQARERYFALAWTPVLADVLMMTMLGALIWRNRHAAEPFPLMYSLTAIIGIVLSVWFIFAILELRSVIRRWRIPRTADCRTAILFAIPLIPGFMVSYFSEWSDYFLIRHFYSEEAVGLFHPAYQYLLIMLGVPTPIATILLARVLADISPQSGVAVKKLVERNAAQIMVGWGLLALGISAVLPWMFGHMLGAHYAASMTILLILLAAIPGAIATHIYNVAYFAQGRLGVSTLGLFGFKAAVNILVSYTLLPIMGVKGSAIGVLVANLVLQWAFLLEQHRYLRLALRHDAFILFMLQVGAILLVFLPEFFPRAVAILLLGCIVIVWARWSRVFHPDEIDAMLPNRLASVTAVLQHVLCRDRIMKDKA